MTTRREVGRYVALAALFAVAAPALVALGRWQLERAGEVRAVAAAFRAAGEAEPLEPGAADPVRHRFRNVALTGRYERGQVLLDNVTRGGAAGYYVLTPFQPAGGGPRVLVNRGWVPADPDRSVVPRVELGHDTRRIEGRVDRLPEPGLSLGGTPERLREGLYRASFPTMLELERLLGVELAAFQIKLDPAAADGFVRDWAPGTARAGRNTAYAGQWFIMAVAAAGLAVWAGVRARRAATGDPERS